MSGCCSCCNRLDGQCMKCAEPCMSWLRCLENLPVIGHIVAAGYGCAKHKSKAERAGLKATIGLIFGIIQFPVELVDESVRRRSPKLYSTGLSWRADWMKSYDHMSLAQLCLPATHQSATYTTHKKLRALPLLSGWSECQNISIRDQLEGGIRFLDLRVMSYENELWTHHNVIICVKLSEIFKEIKEFINNHSDEVVGIYITNDGKDLNWDDCMKLIEKDFEDRLILEYMRDQPIGSLVSKRRQIAIFGVDRASYSWNNMKYHWPNKSSPDDLKTDLLSILDEMGTRRPFYQFWYKAECTPNKYTIIRSIGGVPSVAVQSCTNEKFDFLDEMSFATNYVVLNILKEASQLPFHIFSVDFVHDDIVDRIIELNNRSVRLSATGKDFNDQGSTLSTTSSFEIGPARQIPLQIWETTITLPMQKLKNLLKLKRTKEKPQKFCVSIF